MDSNKPLVNRVAQSGLVNIDLEQLLSTNPIAILDIKDFLFMEMILKEKEFRADMDAHDWSQYEGKTLLVQCSIDAIIPKWAYMLIAVKAQDYVKDVFVGTETQYYFVDLLRVLDKIDYTQYQDQRIIIKGCGKREVDAAAYLEIAKQLKPYAKSIMYGEACSTVPIFKKTRS